MIRSVLGAVILAFDPLQPSMIAALLRLDLEDVSPILLSLHSLLLLHGRGWPVQPFHKSFPDFIVDPNRCTNWKFHISPPNHHSELVIGCLKLMNFNLCTGLLGDLDAINSDPHYFRKLLWRDDGSLKYACQSWHKHLANASKAPDQMPKVTSILHEFLEETFLSWLEALSILGKTRDTVEVLEEVSRWLEVCQFYLFNKSPLSLLIQSRHHQPLGR